ncbi:D-sedoheptulose-7-phosphate isomerase [Sulfuriroseicoccus oceanibius]|uniref:Phosphoheptose isomerase n=1 Tax=Sulfuriroseicoccus oceanibius TaxID=2707525 RepID=A0A6B3LBG8_9BACT|nr:SIS domain-containing protein [Sulfuriroseicoccus oceanibius]QQL44867.1 SIS domain-containing protein [Sulfuriroseicoccus oceanibius]
MSASESIEFNQLITDATRAIETVRELEPACLDAVGLIETTLKFGGKVMACGNGGSAADASHFTTELLCRFENDRRALAAIALTQDGGFMTACGNDYSFEDLFSRQIDGLGREGDVLVVMSTSGNSPNVIKAIHSAKHLGVKTIALLGRDGGNAKGLADVELIVPVRSTARIQEGHKVIIHILCRLLEKRLFG